MPGTAARADDGILQVLCGIVPALDALLGCPQSTTTASDSPAPSPPVTASGSPAPSSPPPTVRSAAAVRATAPTVRFAPDLLLVTFREAATRPQIVALLRSLGARLARTIPKIGVSVVHAPPGRRNAVQGALRRSPLVLGAQRDPVLQALDTTPNDELWPSQWGLRQLDLPRAWDLTQGAASVIVAVVDTGVDAGHPDLRDAVLPGLDITRGGTDASDDEGHGTAVAGIIAARTDNFAGQAGVCWNCVLLPVKVLDANGAGDTSTVAAGIVRAVDLGARVINLSLGGPVPTQALADAVAYAQQKDVVVVAAAGNSATAAPFYPAAYPGVVAVAASDPGTRLYPWSDYGDWVGLAAPGCNVAPALDGGYRDFCGTSSATPIVAGLAALAVSAAPAATNAEIVAALEKASSPIGQGVRYGDVRAVETLEALGIRAPARVLTTTITGSLSRAVPTRRFARAVVPGRVAVSLFFTGSGSLTVTVTTPGGTRLARRSGESPLRLSVRSGGGLLRFLLSGARAKHRFTLTLAGAR